MVFKGNIPWNKGLTIESDERIKKYIDKRKMNGLPWHSNETKNEIKLSKIGKKQLWREGTHHTAETKRRIRDKLLGNVPWNKNKKGDKRLMKKHNMTERGSETLSKLLKETRKTYVIPIKDTSIEVKIQNFLKELKIQFLTHQYIKILHGYQCDIFIPNLNLVIECDGNYWHKYPVGTEIDKIRTKELIEKGFKVLRLWESEIRTMYKNDLKNKIGCYIGNI